MNCADSNKHASQACARSSFPGTLTAFNMRMIISQELNDRNTFALQGDKRSERIDCGSTDIVTYPRGWAVAGTLTATRIRNCTKVPARQQTCEGHQR